MTARPPRLGASWAVQFIPDWMDRAACAGVGGDFWFPEMGESSRYAKRVCDGCPVRQECLEYALDTNEHWGVWGGLSEHQRRQMKQERRVA